MRLLIVTNDYPPKLGGIQQYLGSLVDAYPDEVRVLAPADGPATTATGESIVDRSEKTFMWPEPGVARWVTDQAHDFGADFVLFGAPLPLAAVGTVVRSQLGVPTGVICHGAEVTLTAAFPVARQLMARVLRQQDVLFAVSDYTRRRVESISGRPVTYLGAGVDTEIFHPAPSGDTDGPPVVGCVSRLVPRKGQHRLIEAAALLQHRGRPVRLLFAGIGRKEADLRKMADVLGVDARFEIDVPWSKLAAVYREMDVFCMPCRSRWLGMEIEGLGLVYLEAAASGVPLIAGTSGGAPETVIPGVTGFIADNPASIAEGIELMLSEPGAVGRMGAAGRQFVLDNYTWDRVVQRLLDGAGTVA